MKTIALLLSLIVAAPVIAQNSIRPITQINDINKVGQEYYDKPIVWFAGDSIRVDVMARDVRTPLDFTGIVFPVFFVARETNHAQVFIAATGSVVSATNGHVRVFVTSTNALLPPTNTYAAWMTVFRVSNGATSEVATVAYSTAEVKPSPFGVNYTYLQPTNAPFQFTFGDFGDPGSWSGYPATNNVDMAQKSMTNINSIGADASFINFPDGTFQGGPWTFDEKPTIPGYATGTPLFVESDPVWVAASTGYATKVQIANMATGSPVYAESDPRWSAVSNAVQTSLTNKAAASYLDNLPAMFLPPGSLSFANSGRGHNATAHRTDIFGTNWQHALFGLYMNYGPGIPTNSNIPGLQLWQYTTLTTSWVAGAQSPRIGAGLHDADDSDLQYQFYGEAITSNHHRFVLETRGASGMGRRMTVDDAGNMIVSGTVSAVSYIGNGAGLSGVATGIPLYVETGTGTLNAASLAPYITSQTASNSFAPSNALYAVNGQNITGRWFAINNTVGSDFAWVGGGFVNISTGTHSSVGGGTGNKAQSGYSTIAGGFQNAATGIASTVGGGYQNSANTYGTSSGGLLNNAAGLYSSIPGGYYNTASDYSFAAGIRAAATNTGSFVWSGSGNTDDGFGSRGDNTFNVRSVGGMYFLSPALYIQDTNGATWASLTPTGGMHVGTNSFTIDGAGNVTQSVDNVTWLGTTTVAAIRLGGVTLTDWSRFATGTPIYSLAGYATGTPIYTTAGLATGTPIYSLAGYATGTPIYSVAGLATGTPIYSVSGLATGSPLYAESDPVWVAASTGYATKVQLSAYATGTPIYTVSGLATGTPIYSTAGLATGTPLYAFAETDGVWTAASTGYLTKVAAASLYATGTPVYTTSGLATGTPLYAYTESDPIWASASNLYATVAAMNASNTAQNASIAGKASTGSLAAVEADVSTLMAATGSYYLAANGSNFVSGSTVTGIVNGITVTNLDFAPIMASTNINAGTNALVNVGFVEFEDNIATANNSLGTTNGAIRFRNSSGTLETIWTSGNLNPVTVPSGNTNYWRIVSPPASATSFGAWGYMAVDNTNLYIYNAASSRWLRVQGSLTWP